MSLSNARVKLKPLHNSVTRLKPLIFAVLYL